MLCNSYTFIFAFLPVALLGYALIGRTQSRGAVLSWLIAVSVAFYGLWNPISLLIILPSVAVNYLLARWMQARLDKGAAGDHQCTGILTLGIVFNLCFLGYFKYKNFFLDSANDVLGTQFALAATILPLGISFYTFTQIAYLVDAYREDLSHYDFLTYNLFITYFPQLIAGPLLLHKELMPQLAVTPAADGPKQYLTFGLIWFGLGLCKKVLFADPQSQ